MTGIRTKSLFTASVLALCATPACQHDISTPFPAGLTPVDASVDILDADVDAAAYPQTLSIQQGTDSTSDYANGTGYVHTSIEDVWAALKIPNVVVDRHGISSYTVTPNVEPGYDVSFATNYTVNNVITVTFTLTWREGVVAGTEAAPTGVSVNYEKTEGSSLISLMKGSIEVVAITPTITELTFAQRMSAQNTNSGTIATWMQEIFDSVIAQVNGQPLP